MGILILIAIAIGALYIYIYQSEASTNHLRDLLAAKKWRDDNKETERLLTLTTNRAMGLPSKLERGTLGFKEFGCIPCPILRTIDQLWVQYSDGHFGFSIQLGILEECKKADDWKKKEVKEFDRGIMCGDVQEHFLKLSWSLVPLADPVEVVMLRERLGWITRCYTTGGYSFMGYVDPSELQYSIRDPKGHLPVYDGGMKIFNSYMLSVWQRLKDCC